MTNAASLFEKFDAINKALVVAIDDAEKLASSLDHLADISLDSAETFHEHELIQGVSDEVKRTILDIRKAMRQNTRATQEWTFVKNTV